MAQRWLLNGSPFGNGAALLSAWAATEADQTTDPMCTDVKKNMREHRQRANWRRQQHREEKRATRSTGATRNSSGEWRGEVGGGEG